MAALTLGALGVVFGDIGTSPLYALQTVFTPTTTRSSPTQADVYGVISLVFWALTLDRLDQVRRRFIMRADNDGEGGIMALIALDPAALARPRAAEGRAGRRSASSARRCSTATG